MTICPSPMTVTQPRQPRYDLLLIIFVLSIVVNNLSYVIVATIKFNQIKQNLCLQQPSQIMKGQLITPLRSGAKKSWLLDDDKQLYRRNAEYRKGRYIISFVNPFT